MRYQSIPIIMVVCLLFLLAGTAFPQEVETVTAKHADIGEGLDLQAVSELFKDSKNLEEFEQSLNDPDVGINNLDLDDNGEVDFIRVVEEVADDTHVIILQALLGEDEIQDVATIEMEKSDEDEVNLQVHGNEDIYGSDYYVAPSVVHVHTWPVVRWVYRPGYRPYRSVYRFGAYPRWWKPYRHVTVTVYRPRISRWTGRKHFVVTRKSRVRTVHRVHYRPHRSVKVTRVRRVSPGIRRPAKPKSVSRRVPPSRKPVVKKKK
jgi:hypothetical protein